MHRSQSVDSDVRVDLSRVQIRMPQERLQRAQVGTVFPCGSRRAFVGIASILQTENNWQTGRFTRILSQSFQFRHARFLRDSPEGHMSEISEFPPIFRHRAQ